MIEVHPTARVSPLADVEDSSRGTRVVIGPGVMVDAFVKIKCVGGSGDVVLSEGVMLNSGTVVYSGNGVRLGAGTLVAANCTIAPVNHAYAERGRTVAAQRFAPSRGGVVTGADCWLGAGCVLLDGATLGDGVVVGALSLVRGALPAYAVCTGRPATVVGWRT